MIIPARIHNISRGTLIQVHIADLHFNNGNVNAETRFKILEEQFLNRLETFKFDIVSVNGDIFDHKLMSNSPAVYYAMLFVERLLNICRKWNATCVLIHGTDSHDAGQLQLFYPFLNDNTVDLRIVEEMKFEYIKGAKILCIPEEYNKGEVYYKEKLYSDEYDAVFMHGTVVDSVIGATRENLNSDRYPVFDLSSFALCRGPIIAGHVHTGGCFKGYMYYCTAPIRDKFGEEANRGFLIVLHNLDTHEHYTKFETIESFRYDTINIDHLNNMEIDEIKNYLLTLQSNGIHNIKARFTNFDIEKVNILSSYFRNNRSIIIDDTTNRNEVIKTSNDNVVNKYKDLDFLLDDKLTEYEKFVGFVNYKEGSQFITLDELKVILKDN